MAHWKIADLLVELTVRAAVACRRAEALFDFELAEHYWPKRVATVV